MYSTSTDFNYILLLICHNRKNHTTDQIQKNNTFAANVLHEPFLLYNCKIVWNWHVCGNLTFLTGPQPGLMGTDKQK